MNGHSTGRMHQLPDEQLAISIIGADRQPILGGIERDRAWPAQGWYIANREAMAQRRFTPHWTVRWWLRPGELLWSAMLEGVRWEVDLAWVDTHEWGLNVYKDQTLVSDALVWDLDTQDYIDEPTVSHLIYGPLEENLRQRAQGIGPMNEGDREILRHAVSVLGEAEWITGRKLRQKLRIEDFSEFQQRVARLTPRYLRMESGNAGDYYSPTLPGLLQIEDDRIQQTLRHLIAALTRRYDIDPDARTYGWEDLSAVGLVEADVKLAWSIASIAHLLWGGGMASGGDQPTMNLGMPRDAEQLVIACRSQSFPEYLMEAANRLPDEWPDGQPPDRPWPTAPALLESDDSPMAQHSAPNVQVLAPRDQAPFHLKDVSLSGVRGIEDLQITLTPPSADSGQWMILLGENGSGKTSILRAITLALCSNEVVQALLGRLGTSSPMVRIGNKQASIQLVSRTGRIPHLLLNANQTGDSLGDRGNGESSYPFVVAYGCRRGSALGGAAREVNAASSLSAVETLFDEGAGLVHAETWLRARKLAAVEQGGAEADFYQALEATLTGSGELPGVLPGIDAIHVTGDRVEVEGPAVGRIPFGSLSDGYLTTAGWILDLIARWVEDARLRGTPLDGSFSSRMTGIAVVDEIDLHLHPQWQRDVIGHIRRHFPLMSFIVTTHNPLTLLGGRTGEIYVLGREAVTGRVTAFQRDLPLGAGAEGILTGDWFGLASTLDDNTLKLLEEHRRLLRDGKAGTPKAKALEEKLATRLGSYAVTSLERLAQSAAARVLDDDARQLSAAEREAALAKMVEIIKKPGPGKKGTPSRRKAR